MSWGEVPMIVPTTQQTTSESRRIDELLESLLAPSEHSNQPPTLATDQVSPAQQIDSSAKSSPESDPLDFVTTTVDDAVNRINNEYFFRRDTSEICRQSALTGELQVLTPQQFKTALAGRWVETENPKTGKMGTREAATVWLESRSRREVLGIQYSPNNLGLRQRHLNLWLGWGMTPAPGDCSIIVDHVRDVIASGNNRKAKFIIDWCADILQNPTRKPGVAIVLRGSEGTGKTVLGAILTRVLGARNVVVNADKDRLLGRFNSALAGKILIQAEETFFARRRANCGRSKAPNHWSDVGGRT
jgi:hypothetical protein